MATPHNQAEKGQIAKTVLMPGDPLRAKFIADHFLDNPVQFNSVRNILGFTGTYEGHPVSVMPIDYALRKGADEIIAVDLNQDPQHPNFIERPHINYILPLIDTGFILNFDHAELRSTCGVPDGYECIGSIIVGHPAEEVEEPQDRNQDIYSIIR